MYKSYKNSGRYCEDINQALIKHLPEGSLVLDAGCGYGTLWEGLKDKKNYVVGLDIEKSVLEVSKNRFNEFYQLDVTNFDDVLSTIKIKDFDVILFADILEHVYDPLTVLVNYQTLLKKGGKIIISIPNVVVWDVRLKFLLGGFDYTDTGTCDSTHVRFFTMKSFTKLLDEANLKIVEQDFNPGIFRPFVPIVKKFFKNDSRAAILDSPLYKGYLKYIYPTEKIFCNLNKKLFAFQFIFVAEKDD